MDGTLDMKPHHSSRKTPLFNASPRFPLLLAGAAVALTAPRPVAAQFLYQGWELHQESPRQLELRPEAFVFSSSSNFGPTGTQSSIQDLNGLLRTEAGLAARYGLNEKVTLFGRFAWGVVTVDQLTSTYSGMGYGLTDQNVGFSIRLFGSGRSPSPFTLDLQSQLEFPLYRNATALTAGYPFLGDGTIDVTVGPFVGWTMASDRNGSWRLIGGSGFTWRSDSFSGAIPYSFAIERSAVDTGLTLRVIARGQASLRSDPRGLVGDTGSSTAVNGGSYTANAVNPSLLALEGRIGFQFAPSFEAHVFAGAPIWGQDVPGGWLGGIGITTRLGPTARSARSKPTSAEYDRSNQGFLDYSLEAKVSRVNDKLNLVKIDKGSLAGIEAGQLFDVFSVRENGGVGEAVARARVSSVQANEAALVVTEYYREVWIDEGFVAKRVIR